MSRNIYYRQGVSGRNLHNSIRKKLPIIEKIYKEHRSPMVHITSTDESSGHMASSLHYVDKAIDILQPMSRHSFPDVDTELSATVFIDLKEAFGNDYDVVWHKGSHFHLEFDPD